jgi:hypothetical protein
MRTIHRTAVLILILGLYVSPLAAVPPDAAGASRAKVSRWESNLSIGSVSNGRIGIVKSIWWFAVPKVFAVGLSFDYVTEFIPFSAGVTLNAPIPVVVPFVCAGAGTSLTVGSITNFGGGVKIRLGRKFGLIAEYRKYHYTHDVGWPSVREKGVAEYFGAGIAWIY